MSGRKGVPRTLTAYDWIDDRLRISSYRKLVNHIFPDHWSFMLGELAMYSFILLVVTGVFLSLYFVPSDSTIVYHGVYVPLQGLHVSEAYASAVDLSFSVRAGLLMRQAHHWAADIFIAAIVVHMARVFFTGAFRRPRDINWMIGATMLLLAIFNGFLGYSLPDDMVSGEGVRISLSIIESIPLVGSYLAVWLFGGHFPGHIVTERFFIIHVLILPGLIAAFLSAHLALIWHQEHTEFKKKGASEGTITGTPLWPGFMAKSAGYMLVAFGVIMLLAAFVQINPIWQYGPFDPAKATDAAQPDWYMGWLEGALRMWPPWETVIDGHMVSAVFYPAVLLPVGTWMLMYAWPYLEAHFTGDHRPHNLLDHPRDRPVRTAIGAGLFMFYFVLFVAGGDDVIADFLQVSLNDTLWGMRIAVAVVPLLTGLITYKTCKELQHLRPRTKRPRHLIVERAERGYYVATEGLPVPAAPEPGPIEVETVVGRVAETVDAEVRRVGGRRVTPLSKGGD